MEANEKRIKIMAGIVVTLSAAIVALTIIAIILALAGVVFEAVL